MAEPTLNRWEESWGAGGGTLDPLGTKDVKGGHEDDPGPMEANMESVRDWNVASWPAPEDVRGSSTVPGSGEPLIYTNEFCWNVTDWVGSLLDEVATADSRTTWILDPSLFCLTFSVTLTLRLRSVEKPEEHSVSVGELGHE